MPTIADNVRIRPMTAEDLPQVLEIAAGSPELPRWQESAYLNALDPGAALPRIALVAALSKPRHVMGFVIAGFQPHQAELESIAVSAGSRRLGLGRALFDGLVIQLRSAGVPEVVLEVRASNRAAIAFYRSTGFGQTGLRRAYYADPIEDAVLMRLQFI